MNREEEIEQQTFVYYETCSDEDIAKSKGFIDGANWADQHPRKGLCDAEKVIDWLNSWFTDDICKCCLPITKDARDTFFNDLRKAMED